MQIAKLSTKKNNESECNLKLTRTQVHRIYQNLRAVWYDTVALISLNQRLGCTGQRCFAALQTTTKIHHGGNNKQHHYCSSCCNSPDKSRIRSEAVLVVIRRKRSGTIHGDFVVPHACRNEAFAARRVGAVDLLVEAAEAIAVRIRHSRPGRRC